MTAPRWDMLRDREAHVLVQKGPREPHPDPLLFKPRRTPAFVPFAWRERSKDLHSMSHAITIGCKECVVALVAELRLRAPCPTPPTPIASALPTACETTRYAHSPGAFNNMRNAPIPATPLCMNRSVVAVLAPERGREEEEHPRR